MNYRLIRFTFFLLVLLSLWSPNEDLLPSWVALLRYAVFLSLSGCIIFFAYSSQGFRLPTGFETTLVGSFLVYLSISAVWGDQHPDSYIKGLLIFNAALTSLCVANTLSLEDSLRIIFSGLATFLIICLFVVAAFPDIGIDSSWEHAGKWQGLAGQKNGFGAIAAFTLVAAIALPLKLRATPLQQLLFFSGRIIILLLALLSVYMAGSRGTLVIAAIGVTSLFVARVPKVFQRVVLITLILLSPMLLDILLSTIEVDADKIGVAGIVVDTNSRMKLWRFGFAELAGRELIGVGLDSFWTEGRKLAFTDTYGWVLDNFHNGYITILIEAGIIGLILYIVAFAAVYTLLIVSIGTLQNKILGLTFAYVNMFTVINLVENEIGRSTSLLIFMFTILSLSLRAYITRLMTIHVNAPSHNHV